MNKSQKKKHFSAILNSYHIGETVSDEHHVDLEYLLSHHPSVERKVGAGVDHFYVGPGKYKGTRCFYVVRVDGSQDEFGIGKCIDGEASLYARFTQAARRAIESDIFAYKRAHAVGAFEGQHVDHKEPLTFAHLTHQFIDEFSIDLAAVEYDSSVGKGHVFADAAISEHFRTWHNERAELQIIPARENLAKSHLGRRQHANQSI